MSDSAAVLLAVAAWAGAWAAAPVSLLPATVLAAAGLALRRPALLCLGVALATSGLASRSRAGLHPPVTGSWSGVVTLAGDPEDVFGALRVVVRVERKRLEAWARGGRAGELHDRLAGERVWLSGRVERLPPSVQERLASRHVAGRLTVERVGEWSPGGPLSRVANGLRRTVLGGASSLPPERRALFGGFVLGDDRGQSVELADDFRASGLTHLLVVSGQNVAFVLVLAGPALKRLGLRSRFVAGLAVLALFGTLTRWEPSVLRAVAMAALALLAGTLGRPASGLRVLALAVTGLLLIDPLVAGSVGFQLSVGACAGIALLAGRIERALPGPRWLASTLGVTLAAQAGVAPVLVPVFGSLPVAAVPANVLALPAAAPLSVWAMAAGVPAGVAGGAVARLTHLPTDFLLRWVAGVARAAASAPLGQLRAAHLVAMVALLAIAVGVSRRTGRWRIGLPAAALAVIAVAAALPAVRPGPLDDRGVGTGARIWRRDGSTVLVVDGARSSAALLTGLRSVHVRRLDVVVVARPGPGAAAAVEPVLDRHPPGLLVAPEGSPLRGAVDPGPGFAARAGPLTVTVRTAGARLEVTVDHPPH